MDLARDIVSEPRISPKRNTNNDIITQKLSLSKHVPKSVQIINSTELTIGRMKRQREAIGESISSIQNIKEGIKTEDLVRTAEALSNLLGYNFSLLPKHLSPKLSKNSTIPLIDYIEAMKLCVTGSNPAFIKSDSKKLQVNTSEKQSSNVVDIELSKANTPIRKNNGKVDINEGKTESSRSQFYTSANNELHIQEQYNSQPNNNLTDENRKLLSKYHLSLPMNNIPSNIYDASPVIPTKIEQNKDINLTIHHININPTHKSNNTNTESELKESIQRKSVGVQAQSIEEAELNELLAMHEKELK